MLRLARHLSLFKGFSTKVNPVIQSVEELTNQKAIKVKWSDEKTGVFPFVWLRDSSPDPQTFHMNDSFKTRSLLLKNLDLHVAPSKVSIGGQESVEVSWPDGVQSSFKSDWLRFRNPTDLEQRRLRKRAFHFRNFQTWGAEELRENLREFKFEEIQTDKQKLHDCLLELCQKGVVLVKTSGKKGLVQELADLIGYPYPTHFGTFWDVEIKEAPPSIAYTSNEIGPHTDEPSYPTNPQVITFHMIRNTSSEGGQTSLTDGFRVAELLKEERPDLYDLLTQVPVEFLEEGRLPNYEWKMASRHKVIELDEDGLPYKCFFSSHQRTWFLDSEPEKIVRMYEALKVFNEYCHQERNMWKRKMQNSDMLLCANDRLLHGRTGYKMSAGDSRLMEGCYFQWDVVHSKIRVIREELQLPENQPSF